MKKLLIILFIFLHMALGANENFLHFTFNIGMMVFNPEESQETILDWVKDQEGKFLFRSENQLNLRLPWEASMKLHEYLKAQGLELLNFDQNAFDLREEILRLKSGIKSRQEILAKNLALIDRADISGTLAIEKEVVRLIQEIETRKCQLNKLEYDRKMARVEMYFNFKQSSRPENVDSAFQWLNQIDMYDFLKGAYDEN